MMRIFFLMMIQLYVTGIVMVVPIFAKAQRQQCENLFSRQGLRPQWTEDILLSQSYNPPFRQKEILPPEQREARTMYSFELPRSQVQLVRSKFGVDLSFEKTEKEDSVQFFIVDDQLSHFSEIKNWLDQQGVRLNKKYLCLRLQSKFTFFVWNPQDKNEKPFYVKLQRFEKNGTTYNDKNDSVLAVKVNDYLATLFAEDPSDFISFMRESRAQVARVGGIELAQSFRETVNEDRAHEKTSDGLDSKTMIEDNGHEKKVDRQNVHEKIWTANGFLSSSKLDQVARQSGMSAELWIHQEYLPKLAKYMAEMSFRYGVIPEAHTQNLTFAVDELTGRISRFYLKDVVGIHLNAFARVINGRATYLSNLDGHFSVGRLNELSTEVGVAPDAGSILASYTMQSVLRLTENPQLQKKRALIFLEHFIVEIEKVLMLPIEKNESGLALLAEKISTLSALKLNLKKWVLNEPPSVEVNQIMRRAINIIFDQVYIRLWPSFSLEQEVGRNISKGGDVASTVGAGFAAGKGGVDVASSVGAGVDRVSVVSQVMDLNAAQVLDFVDSAVKSHRLIYPFQESRRLFENNFRSKRLRYFYDGHGMTIAFVRNQALPDDLTLIAYIPIF